MIDCATAFTLEFIRTGLPAEARRVLEVGCGDGALAAALAADGIEVVAIDSDPGKVAQASRRRIDARVAEWPDFADGRFDAVLFTRSLHHVGDLEASVTAAVAALADEGRIIVEDFRAEGEPPRSAAWFDSLVRLLDSARLLTEPTEFLRQRLGLAPRHRHDDDHHLHGSAAIEAALAEASALLHIEDAAYYFRYLLPALGRGELGEALLTHERELIATNAIDALGRRYVAARSSA